MVGVFIGFGNLLVGVRVSVVEEGGSGWVNVFFIKFEDVVGEIW